MLDRIPSPGKEGRMLITPEDGSPAFYARVTMADEPLQEGDPLAKATLLTDETAGYFGGDQAFKPSDVLRFLGRRNLHWWRKTLTTYSERRRPEAALTLFSNGSADSGYVAYSSKIKFNEITGVAELIDPAEIHISSANFTAFNENCLGKYISLCYAYGHPYAQVYYIPADATVTGGGGGSYAWHAETDKAAMITTAVSETVSYVVSEDRSSYPTSGSVDGAKYSYIGIPFENAEQAPRMELLSYIVSGTFTEDEPYALTASFAPDLWVNLGQYHRTIITGSGTFVPTASAQYALSRLMTTEYNELFWGRKTKLSEDGKTMYFPMSGDDAVVVYVLAIKFSSPTGGMRDGADSGNDLSGE